MFQCILRRNEELRSNPQVHFHVSYFPNPCIHTVPFLVFSSCCYFHSVHSHFLHSHALCFQFFSPWYLFWFCHLTRSPEWLASQATARPLMCCHIFHWQCWLTAGRAAGRAAGGGQQGGLRGSGRTLVERRVGVLVGGKVGQESAQFPKELCRRSFKSYIYFTLSRCPQNFWGSPKNLIVVLLTGKYCGRRQCGIESNSSGLHRPANCLGIFISRAVVIEGGSKWTYTF